MIEQNPRIRPHQIWTPLCLPHDKPLLVRQSHLNMAKKALICFCFAYTQGCSNLMVCYCFTTKGYPHWGVQIWWKQKKSRAKDLSHGLDPQGYYLGWLLKWHSKAKRQLSNFIVEGKAIQPTKGQQKNCKVRWWFLHACNINSNLSYICE